MQMSHSKLLFFSNVSSTILLTRDSFQWKNDTRTCFQGRQGKQLDFNRILLQWDTENSWNATKMASFILFLTFIEGMPECHIPIRLLGFARFVVWKGICCWAWRSHPYFFSWGKPRGPFRKIQVATMATAGAKPRVPSQGIAGLNGLLIIEFPLWGPAISWGWWLWGGPP